MRCFVRVFLVGLALAVALVVSWFAGPRVAIDKTLDEVGLPESPAEIAEWIQEQEALVPDLVEGTEKRVTLVPEVEGRTPLSVVFIHGFTATRQEVDPVAVRVAERLGAHLFEARVAGHGRTDPDALLESTVNAWVNDAAEAVEIGRRLGDEVVVIGASTGASTLLWLMAQPGQQENVAALIAMAPNFGVPDERAEMVIGPWGLQLAKRFLGDYTGWEPINEDHATYWTPRYPTPAVGPPVALGVMAREAALESIRVPTTVMYSKKDQVIDPAKLEAAFVRIGGGEGDHQLMAVETEHDEGHILAGRIISPGTVDEMVERVLGRVAP
ncbi:MAG: alpha/beta hydrolase [Verrucomicrobiota bacterium]